MSRRHCCPKSKVDWSQPGGLINCNWPCCIMFDSEDFEQNYRVLREDPANLMLEMDVSPAFPPLCMLCMFSFFPVVPCMFLAAGCMGQFGICAWLFEIHNDSLVLEERVKYVCSEERHILLQDITSVSLETHVAEGGTYEESQIIQGRLVVKSHHNHNEVKSPWKLMKDDRMIILCERICSMIPASAEQHTG